MHPRQWWDAGNDPSLKDIPKDQKESGKDKNDVAATAPADEVAAGAASRKRLRAIVEPLGARHLVFGHQPGKVTFADGTVRDPGQMFTKFEGLVFLIDTGMSRGVSGGRGAILRISHGKATAVYADRKTALLWE